MTDPQTELRDRIAALFRHRPGDERLGDATPGEIADAVLAELPQAADRTAVLHEDGPSAAVATWKRAADLLRRLAAETQQQPDTEAHPPTHAWKVESPRRDNWASWGATYDERKWAAESFAGVIEVAPQRPFRLVRETTTYTVEAEHTPPAVSEPAADGEEPQS